MVAAVDWQGVTHDEQFIEGVADAENGILARTSEVDLVVMGTHGRTGVWRFLLGNVAYRVLEGAGVPVVVVPTLID
jgi:nucleotide-binding universal stress UspA family protein